MTVDWNQKVVPGVKLAEGNRHGFVGVYYDRRKAVFRAEFWHKNKRLRSSGYLAAEEAAKWYDECVRELRGSGYPVNFPVGDECGFVNGVDLERYCARGHPREGNTYYRPGSAKGHCRACNLLASKRKYQRLSRGVPPEPPVRLPAAFLESADD